MSKFELRQLLHKVYDVDVMKVNTINYLGTNKQLLFLPQPCVGCVCTCTITHALARRLWTGKHKRWQGRHVYKKKVRF